MAIYRFEERIPRVSVDAYVSPEATIVGDVVIGPGCFIGPGARIKGDYGAIVVGDETSIQENCVVHARPGERCEIGSRVNVGHGAIIHGGFVGDGAVVGMGAIISDFATIGDYAIVAEGCVVPAKMEIPERKIAVGVPAKVIGDVTDETVATYEKFKDIYVDLSRRYKTDLVRTDDDTQRGNTN
jgi:carbonic anhydrase/acetyltransferase-like protein (isoleucine patch superfamily)